MAASQTGLRLSGPDSFIVGSLRAPTRDSGRLDLDLGLHGPSLFLPFCYICLQSGNIKILKHLESTYFSYIFFFMQSPLGLTKCPIHVAVD